jgi:hypothetical protein
MAPEPPFWFKQRQCKAEPAGSDTTLKLSGPNLQEAYIRIEPQGGRWSAALRLTPDGVDVSSTDPVFDTPVAAWQAAFELYRRHIII